MPQGSIEKEHRIRRSDEGDESSSSSSLSLYRFMIASKPSRQHQKDADVWEKHVWEFQAKSGSSGSCCLFLYFLGKIAVQEMSGKTPGIGAGVLHKFGADVFFVFFFFWLPSSGLEFQTNGMFKTGFLRRFLRRPIFAAQSFAPTFAQIFGAQIFAQIFRRCFFDVLALQKLVFQSHARMRRKSAEKAAASEWPRSGGYPIPCPLSRADSTSHNRR